MWDKIAKQFKPLADDLKRKIEPFAEVRRKFSDKKYKEGLKFCFSSIKNFSVAYTYLNRGEKYFENGEYEKAINDYSKAIELEPKFKKDAKEDKDFDEFWNDPDFIKLVE